MWSFELREWGNFRALLFFFFLSTTGSNFADQKSVNRTHCNGEQHLHRRERAVHSVTWGKSLSLIFALCKHDAISVP